MAGLGRLCCKSPKLPGDDFLTVRRPDRRTPVCAASITLPGSPVSLSVGDEAPHIFTRRSRLKPGEFLITSAKRLLQHNRHEAADRGSATSRQILRVEQTCHGRRGTAESDPLQPLFAARRHGSGLISTRAHTAFIRIPLYTLAPPL